MTDPIVQGIVDGDWGARTVDRGAMVLVCTTTGRVLYQDPRFSKVLGKPLAPNAFDSIPADLAAKAGEMVAQNVGIDMESEFPFVDADGRSIWMRFEVTWHPVMIAMAVWPLPGDEPRKVISRPLSHSLPA